MTTTDSQPARPEGLVARTLRRYWARILVQGLILSTAIESYLYMTPLSHFEATCLLRVEPAGGTSGEPSEAFAPFLQTQAALLTSPVVLGSALREPAVAAVPAVRSSADPEAALRGMVRAEVVPGTYLLRILASGTSGAEAAAAANGVTDAYLKSAFEWSDRLSRTKLEELEVCQVRLSERQDEKRKALVALKARLNELDVASDEGRKVSDDRFNRFLGDWDVAVVARIKSEATLEAERLSPPKSAEARAQWAERVRALGVKLLADQATEKAMLERVRASKRPGAVDQLEVELAREAIAGLNKESDSVNARLERLRFESRGQPRISRLNSAQAALVRPTVERRTLQAATPVAVFAALFLISMAREGLSRRSRRVAEAGEAAGRVTP